jgi:hypothetical protein
VQASQGWLKISFITREQTSPIQKIGVVKSGIENRRCLNKNSVI